MTTLHDNEVYQTLKDERVIERSTSCSSPDPSPQDLRKKDVSSEYVKLCMLSLIRISHIH